MDLDAINSKVKINSRIPESMASTTTLAQYLFSRSVAGMNAQELIQNIENITDSQITGRFFAFYPPRDINLSQWLAHWIRKGELAMTTEVHLTGQDLKVSFYPKAPYLWPS